MQPYEEENTEDMKNRILARIEELEQEMANIREGWKKECRQITSSLGQETQASIQTLEDQMAQMAKYKEETDGDLRDVVLSKEKEGSEESVTIEKENEEENVENKNVLFEEVHGKIIEEEKKKTRNESVREEAWEGISVVISARKLIGATNPLNAEPGTTRGDLVVQTGSSGISDYCA
nr:nucleoside diphosphate kinase 2, chloroplastic [Ipomoea batatas]GMD13555.1 nucleoside diphosphate kinase 2, chloroplastic [Ipomoea batatas]